MNIYPTQRIARQLNEEDPHCLAEEQIIAEANAYIEIMEEENLQFLKNSEEGDINPDGTYKFLRSHERTRNTKLILQYMITFLSKLPLEDELEAEGRIINPLEQFKMFIINNIDLIKEKDVNDAILREHERLGLLTDTNIWYYRGQIDKSHKMLREGVDSAAAAAVPEYRKLFQGLQRLSTFWFSVRNEEIKRVRKSDLLIYRLSRYLLAKYPETPAAAS